MPELKPCPFCGSADIRKATHRDRSSVWCATCYSCVARGTWGKPKNTLAEAEAIFGKESIEAWNRRAEDGK